MRIQTIGATLLAYADQGELRRRGFRERSIGLREVLLLAREALCQAGLPMERLTEIEAFPRERSLLIFLHMAPPEREWFRFQDLPRALDAVQALMQAPTGTLAWQGCYYLSAAEPGVPMNVRPFKLPCSSILVTESGITTEGNA